MFKNGKEKSVKSIEESSIEQDYKRELKSVLKKLDDHQEKIDNIVEIVSARFGDGVNTDDINKKIKEASSNFADKISSINDANNELYNKCIGLIYTNEENINEIKNSISEKDVQILEINKQLIEMSENEEARKKDLKERFSDVNKKIGKINYTGITGKFEKMQKEQNKKIASKVEEVESSLKEKMDNIRQDLYSSEKSLLEKITGLNEIIDNNQIIIDSLKNGIGTKIEGGIDTKEIAQVFTNKMLELKTENKKSLTRIQKEIEGNAKDIEEIRSKVGQTTVDVDWKKDYETLDKKVMKQVSNFNELVKTNKKYFERIDKVKSQFEEFTGTNKNAIAELASKIEEINKGLNIGSKPGETSQKDIKLLQGNFEKTANDLNVKIEDLYKLIKTDNKATSSFSDSLDSVKKDFSKLDEKTRKTFELLYKDVEDKIENSKSETKKAIEGIKIDEKISSSFNKLKAEFLSETKKQTLEDDKKYQNDVKSLSASVGEVKTSLDASIKNVEKEILKLKEETNAFKGAGNNQDVEELKKSYNQYVKKVDNAIEKLGNTLLSMQEKNKEGNKNLQVRIKNYIDSKNTSTINQMNNLIDKLSLTFKQKEELRQEETKQFINKKLKEIQKENDKIIERRVRELSDSLRKNETYNFGNSNSINTIRTASKKKKSMFDDVFSDNNLLAQTASSNKKLGSTNDERSKILKFFYDDEDEDI